MIRGKRYIGVLALLLATNSMLSSDVKAAAKVNLTTDAKSTTTNQSTVKVISKQAKIRRGPKLKKETIVTVKKGTKLTLIGKMNSVWVKVEHEGIVGYVYNKDAKRLEKVPTSKVDKKAVNAVIQAIKNIRKNVKLRDQEQIELARAAYEALNKASKKEVTNLKKLKKAEQTLQQLLEDSKNKVEQEVTTEQEVTIVEESQEQVVGDVVGGDVSFEGVIAGPSGMPEQVDEPTIEETTVEQEEASVVEEAVPEQEEETVVEETTPEQEEETVVEETTPEQEEETVVEETTTEQEEQSAAYVEFLIQRCDKVIQYEDAMMIKEARTQYNLLSAYAKSLVKNIAILERAEAEHATMKQRIWNVLNMINNIPEEITIEDKAYVSSVRAAYNQLTAEEKKGIYATELSILERSEDAIRRLEAATNV